MNDTRLTLGVLLLAAWPGIGLGESAVAQFVVDPGGAGTHTTIQSAIDDADDGTEIVVNPGLYRERIDFLGKAVRVRSTRPGEAAVVAATVIDGGDAGGVVTFAGGETEASVIEGFTIRNGSAVNGGGVYCNGSSPTIRRNHVIENFCLLHGGGIYCTAGASPAMIENEIADNVCEGRGGGIFADFSSAVIERNRIHSNQAGCSSGGGIHLGSGADGVVVIGNEVMGNKATFGAGVQTEDSSPTIARNTIVGNDSLTRGGGISCVNGSPAIVGNLVVGNHADIAAGAEFNHTAGEVESNTFVGNLAGEAAVVLALNRADFRLLGNIIAFHPAGVAVQAVSGSTVTVDYSCLYANAAGDTAGAVTLGEHNIFEDPLLVVGGAMTTGSPQPAPFCGGELTLDAELSGPSGAFGDARYRTSPLASRFRARAEDFPPGIFVAVSINAVVVGQMFIESDGRGELRYDTEDGTFPQDFPAAAIGDVVDIGGLASGEFTIEGPLITTFWSRGDEHLTAASPCVDAFAGADSAEPADIDGQPRFSGFAIDIGADEWVPPGDGDLDQDGDVDLVDMAGFQACYTDGRRGLPAPGCAFVDLDGDADVDALDWRTFAAAVTGPS